MESRLVIQKGPGGSPVVLVAGSNALVATRTWPPAGHAVFLSVLMVLFAVPLLLVLLASGAMFTTAVTGHSWKEFAAGLAFLAGGVLSGLGFLGFQSELFPFRARVDLERRKYVLQNGLLVTRLSLPEAAAVSISPTCNRGDWDYEVHLKRGRGLFSWLVSPGATMGTKHDAFREAEQIRQFIETHLPVLRVRMDGWGRSKIKPGSSTSGRRTP